MLTYNICHCGYEKDNHHFKHTYSMITTVKKNNDAFYINCLDFKQENGIKCKIPSCKALKSLHKTQVIEHEFDPISYTFRTIRFSIPSDTKCNKCEKTLENHEHDMQHHFTTKIFFEDIDDNDKVIIINPVNEDKKIIY